MKARLLLLGCLLLTLNACNNHNYTSRKKIERGIDYTAYQGAQGQRPSTSDFTSYWTGAPSVLDDVVSPLEGETSGADEDADFTSEGMESSYGRYGDAVVTVAAKKIKLGKSATQKHMSIFQKALDKAYASALRAYRPTGFTYSISSVGAVNPLSDVEVSCMLGEQAASEVGQATCNLFFQDLVTSYVELMKEAQ